MEDIVIVLDCGATNIRAIAVSASGKVVAKAAIPNVTQPAKENSDWHIWPVEDIFHKFSQCSQDIMRQIDPERVKAITVTTFGVDGTFVDKDGQLLYPVISWKCPRNSAAQKNLKKYIDPDWLATHSGIGHFAFNTINKLLWFKENKPDLLETAHAWLFISSIFNHKLTGVLTNDATMVGTSQMTELQTQRISETVCDALGLNPNLFPPMVQAGDVIGTLLPEPAALLGLTPGIPVVSAGHDTQFAIYGSGAEEGQPVLSSGTWEILMARTAQAQNLQPELFANGLTCEWDAVQNTYNPGLQWLGSGVLEWVGRQFYRDCQGEQMYQQMIHEAEQVNQDCQGIKVNPDFLNSDNNTAAGAITGLSISAERGAIYRATLQALAEKLKVSLAHLEHVGGFKANELIIVGGGSKNQLWNQIKADTLQIPVKILAEAETTVLGASMFAMVGAGIYSSPEIARQSFNIQYQTINPTSSDPSE